MTEFAFKDPSSAMRARLLGLEPRCANCDHYINAGGCALDRKIVMVSTPTFRLPTCPEFSFHVPESEET